MAGTNAGHSLLANCNTLSKRVDCVKILVTGASGFVGSSVMRRMALDGRYVVASSQRLTPDADWQSALQDIDMVIHTAARAHLSPDEAKDALAEFRRTNVEGTLCLAQQAAAAGVKRFVFLSSIKVNGERTTKNRRFTAGDVPAPEDAYGQSKFEAEQGLQAIARNSTMELVIIRPPMVYGPGMKGNLAALLRLVARGVPLPLGTVYNKLSLVALDNLVDLIACCLAHPAAANQIFLVSDGCDFSTTSPTGCRVTVSVSIARPASSSRTASRCPVAASDTTRRPFSSVLMNVGSVSGAYVRSVPSG